MKLVKINPPLAIFLKNYLKCSTRNEEECLSLKSNPFSASKQKKKKHEWARKRFYTKIN